MSHCRSLCLPDSLLVYYSTLVCHYTTLPLSASVLHCPCDTLPPLFCLGLPFCRCLCLPLRYPVPLLLCLSAALPLFARLLFCLSAILLLWHSASVYLCDNLPLCYSATLSLSAFLLLCLSATLPLFACLLLCLSATLLLWHSASVYLCETITLCHSATLVFVSLSATLPFCYSVSLALCLCLPLWTIPLCCSLLLSLCLPLVSVWEEAERGPKGKKGRRILLSPDGFCFNVKKDENGPSIFLKCNKKERYGCPATGRVRKRDDMLVSMLHNHTHNSGLLETTVKKMKKEEIENAVKVSESHAKHSNWETSYGW